MRQQETAKANAGREGTQSTGASVEGAQVQDNGPVFLIKAEVAAMLRVSTRTLDRLRAEGNAPAPLKRPGKRPLWRKKDVDRWIAQQRQDRH